MKRFHRLFATLGCTVAAWGVAWPAAAGGQPSYASYSGSYECHSTAPAIERRTPRAVLDATTGWLDITPSSEVAFSGFAGREWVGKIRQLSYYLQTRAGNIHVMRFETARGTASLLLPDSRYPFVCRKP